MLSREIYSSNRFIGLVIIWLIAFSPKLVIISYKKVTCSLSFVLLVKLWHTSYFLWSRSVCLSNQLWRSLGGGVRLPISIVGRSVADGLDIHSVIASLTHSQRISSLSDRWEMDHSLWLLFVFPLYKEVFWTKGIWVSGLVFLPVT